MQRIRKKFLTLAVSASLLLGASVAVTPASAATINFSFTGTALVTNILLSSQGISGGVGSASGSFDYDNITGLISAPSLSISIPALAPSPSPYVLTGVASASNLVQI